MVIQPSILRSEALSLPEDARAELAAELLASLEHDTDNDPDGVHAHWNREIQDRARRAIAGEATSQDWTAVRQRLAETLTE